MAGRLRKALEIADLKRIAQGRVPKMFFDYADSGSWTQSTYLANERDWSEIKFNQRIAVDMTERTLASPCLGTKIDMPLVLSPCGLTGMHHPNGEMLAARAAREHGIPFTLSTMSIASIEDVASALGGNTRHFWFQVYMMRDRAFMENLIRRATEAKCAALVLTLDLQIMGQRHQDVRNDLSAPPKINLNTIGQFATRPGWCLRMLSAKRWHFGNIRGHHAANVSDLSSLATWIAEQFDPRLDWDDVRWVRDRWPGKLVIKGIMDPEDARRAVEEVGAEAIVVSNHGGRQLDGAPSSVSALSSIVKAVGVDTEVHVDGGIRSGQDVIRARCLGATAAHMGRPYLYGLGAAGYDGVMHALDIVRKEADITMALCGERDVTAMSRHNLAYVPPRFG